MKRIFCFLFLLIALLPIFCPAQGTGIQFIIQAGLTTRQDFKFDPAWATVSLQAAIHLNDFLFLAPECTVLVPDLKFKPFFFWSPGVTLNYKFGDIFLGAGASRWIESSKENKELQRYWQIKGQIGLMKSTICLTAFAYMNSDSLFKNMNVGLLIGLVL